RLLMLAMYVAQKTGAVLHRADVEVLRDSLTQIGERAPGAQIDAGLHPRTDGQQRDMLPRMVRAGRRRIVAVIRRDDKQVVLLEYRQQGREAGVEPLEVCGVAGHVVAMAV